MPHVARLIVSSALALATGCGRLDFDPVTDLRSAGVAPDAATALAAACARATPIAPGEPAVVGTLAGATDELGVPPGCINGRELVFRFTGARRHANVRILADLPGGFTIGTGCPITATGPALLCGPLTPSVLSSSLGLELGDDTYLVIDATASGNGQVAIQIDDPAAATAR